jgi:hypothetical protein
LDTTPRTATLDKFRGQDPNGAWTIYFFDASGGAVSTLKGWSVTVSTSSATWYGGGSHEVVIDDATGTAGNYPGWNLLDIPGSLIVKTTPSSKFTIKLATLDGHTAGPAANFNPAYHYGWRIVTTTEGITGFNAYAFTVDTTAVGNTFTGSFNVAAYGNSLYLYYLPARQLTTLGNEVIAGQMRMYFTNVSGLKSVQGIITTNCTIAGTAYNIADQAIVTGLTVVTNLVTDLPPGTTRLDLAATKEDTGKDGWVNTMVKDYFGTSKSFDPVITRLEVTSGNWVQKRFTGLLAAEHYLQVVNATPGLRWLEVTMNGCKFRLDPLSDGQVVASDLAVAMVKGDHNTVVLSGGGEVGGQRGGANHRPGRGRHGYPRAGGRSEDCPGRRKHGGILAGGIGGLAVTG